MAERVRLTWTQCVFPFCTRRARLDLDHREPWPDGPTSSANLAPLCRTHHRMKTFSGWTYEPADTPEHGIPTAFTWTSPTGTRFRADRHGSIALPPGTAAGPASAPRPSPAGLHRRGRRGTRPSNYLVEAVGGTDRSEQ